MEELAAILSKITAVAEQQSQMLAKMNGEKEASTSTSNVNILSNFQPFEEKKETFKQYRKRLENWFELRGIAVESKQCAQELIHSLSSGTFNTLCALTTPDEPGQKSYKELVELLQNHLCPEPNAIVQQHRFLSRRQAVGESIAKYVAELRQLSSTCQFQCTCKKSVADLFLRAQFIRGIADVGIREKLLLLPSDTRFEKVVENALALEASKIDNKEISKEGNGDSNRSSMQDPPSGINRISHRQSRSQTRFNNFNGQNNRFRSQSRGRQSNFGNQRQNFSHKFSKPNYNVRQPVDYKALGLEHTCLRCGRENHLSNSCRVPVDKLYCSNCNRSGHVSKVCLSLLLKKKNNSQTVSTVDQVPKKGVFETNYLEDMVGINKIYDIYTSSIAEYSKDIAKYYVNVFIEGQSQNFEVDSGAGFTLLPESQFVKLKLSTNVRSTDIFFRSYTHGIFKPKGYVIVNVKYNNVESEEIMFIVPDEFNAILGRIWIRHLRIELKELDNLLADTAVCSVNVEDNSVESIYEEFADMFEKSVGMIPGFVVNLKLRSKAKPVFLKARNIPFALRPLADEELDELVSDDIIGQVDHSDWGSPLVPIPKANGKVRLCVDYKIAVNKQLQDAHYPIPRIDEVLGQLRNANFFCTLDLYKAYSHVVVDEESQKIQTMSTHRGTFKVKRLAQGIKTAPSEFHRIIDQILSGLVGITSYFDDIIVFGATLAECRKRLYNCLYRLRKYNLHLNREKCQFFKTSISYLGFVVEHNTIKKCPSKIRAVQEAPRPTTAEEVKRFLGFVTYYSKFIPQMSSITYPLRLLLKKNYRFRWSSACEKAFNSLKAEIISDRVLTPFNPDLPVILACDASPTGIAAVLSHTIDGQDRPIAFISRALTPTESNYSQLDREALAIIYAVNKFFMYLYGRQFTLITDNAPLSRIFHHDAKLPALSTSRLLRYAAVLSSFNYVIKHKKAEEIAHVDFFSRAPLSNAMPAFSEDDILNYQTINQISTSVISAKSIASAISTDPELSVLVQKLGNGDVCDEQYTLQDGVLFRGSRIVIPKSMQTEVLRELHFTHLKISKMKSLARRYCYWKSIDRDIELFVKSCQACASTASNPSKAPLHPWEEPSYNFQRVHMDYAGPKDGFYIFILIDAKSKWPEVRLSKSAPTSASTIRFLKEIFSVHGLPEILVSDNATIFTSSEFVEFCESNGINRRLIAPGHPQTNGQAERYVQFIKSKLEAMSSVDSPVESKIEDILFRYRATPLRCGSTPAELYLGRQIRTKLDLLKPVIKASNSIVRQPQTTCRSFSVGDRVQSRCYVNNRESWKFGVINRKFGSLHYLVKLDDGYSIKRHIDQLRQCDVAKDQSQNRVSFNPVPTVHEYNNPVRQMYFPPANPRPKPNASTSLNTPNRTPGHTEFSNSVRRTTRTRKPPAYLHDYVRH